MRESYNSYRNSFIKKKNIDGQNRKKTDKMKAVNLKNYQKTKNVPPPQTVMSFTTEYQFYQIRQALCVAIEENQILRERVIQLEAFLASAQEKIEDYQENYIVDMNVLQKILLQEETVHKTQTQRSKSL